MAAAIFLMLPTYNGFLADTDPQEVRDLLGSGGGVVGSIGLPVDHLTTPAGVFGFLTEFLLAHSAVLVCWIVAAAISVSSDPSAPASLSSRRPSTGSRWSCGWHSGSTPER